MLARPRFCWTTGWRCVSMSCWLTRNLASPCQTGVQRFRVPIIGIWNNKRFCTLLFYYHIYFPVRLSFSKSQNDLQILRMIWTTIRIQNRWATISWTKRCSWPSARWPSRRRSWKRKWHAGTCWSSLSQVTRTFLSFFVVFCNFHGYGFNTFFVIWYKIDE